MCDRGQVTLVALLDLSATFDTVDHNILLNRLQLAFGIRGTAFKWIESFVTGRVQTVSFASEKSAESKVLCGVPQGSVLGPILFLLYCAEVTCIAERNDIGPFIRRRYPTLYPLRRDRVILDHIGPRTLPWGTPNSTFDSADFSLAKLTVCTRPVTNLRKFDRVSISKTIRNELHWLPVHKRIVYKLCLFVFKCQHEQAPIYLSSLCSPLSAVTTRRQLQAATQGDLDFPRTRTVTYG